MIYYLLQRNDDNFNNINILTELIDYKEACIIKALLVVLTS